MAELDNLEQRLRVMQDRIDHAAREANRDPDEIQLIVVTKFHPPELVRNLVRLGVTQVGENRHQEAHQKAQELAELEVSWNYIGQLQTNKAKQIFDYASSIHSVDRVRLVNALDKAETQRQIDAFIQVNLTDDPGRGGVDDQNIEALTERVLQSSRLNLQGIMAVAPLDEEPARAFARLADYSERVQQLKPQAKSISAGMSHDYVEAIKHGATHLRIGSAITGKRPEAK
ncbi:MAG: YggS family pyridoxal phosphate-dependent enzyme [Canibacter sp.]